MELKNKSILEFAELLASREPVPGGGGASALVAALGMALGSMVANFTLGKKKYAHVEEDIKALILESEKIQDQLISCIDKDAKAFEHLSRAYSIPKEEPGRAQALESCLKDAALVPMDILRLSCRAIELHREYAAKGSAMMQSDVGTGVAFCLSALLGAALNVKVNTKLMQDKEYADMLNAEVDDLVDRYKEAAGHIYEDVYKRYC